MSPPQPSRIITIFALLCAHAAAMALDAIIGVATHGKISICFLATLAILHCDVAILGIWAASGAGRIRRVLLYCSLVSAGAFVAVIAAGGPDSQVLSRFSEFPTGLALLQTLLESPLIVLLFSQYRNGLQRRWFWLETGALLFGIALIAGFTGSLSNHAWSRPWWLERLWAPDEYLVRALVIYVINLTAIFWCGAIFESIQERQPAALWLSYTIICAALIALTSWAIGGNLNTVSWSIFGRPPPWTWHWLTTLSTPLSIPLVSALAMMPISALLRTLKLPADTEPAPVADTANVVLSEGHPSRFQTTAGLLRLALLVSAANLAVGFLQGRFPISGNQFGNHGHFRELLFLAPHGLWAAQAALSAVFFQSSILNYWKRMLVVLVWAELSMAAYWGQVVLSYWNRADPSDFVGAMFHCAVSGLVVGAAGIAVGKFMRKPPVRIACEGLESPNDGYARRSSLSLSDLITIVTAFAAISYPVSVVFAFELWRSPLALGVLVVVTISWTLAVSGAAAIAVAGWLEGKRPSFWWATFCGALLVGSCAHDWATFSAFFTETFFGLRHGYRILALPTMFLFTAIGAIGLRQCGFRMAPVPRKANESAAIEPLTPLTAWPELAEKRGSASPKAASPWD